MFYLGEFIMAEKDEQLKKMIQDSPHLKTGFFKASDLIFIYESKFLLPNFNVILSLWRLENDFFLIYVIFDNSEFKNYFGIPMISSLNEIEMDFQDSLLFNQIKKFSFPQIVTFVYDFNHDGTDEVLYIGFSNVTGYTHFIITGLSVNLERMEMLNIRQFPGFSVYPQFICYEKRQGIKLFKDNEWQFYYYDRLQQKYVQDKNASGNELSQIQGSPDFFAEAGIDYTKLERPLLPSDLEGFSKASLRIWRNAIYARHGRVFKSDDLQALFNEYSWYERDKNYNDDKLSDIDKLNIELIKKFEK
jgi:hypothetical protein